MNAARSRGVIFGSLDGLLQRTEDFTPGARAAFIEILKTMLHSQGLFRKDNLRRLNDYVKALKKRPVRPMVSGTVHTETLASFLNELAGRISSKNPKGDLAREVVRGLRSWADEL